MLATEFLSAEKFFVFLLTFQMKKNKDKIIQIFTTYENLPRENIIIDSFKEENIVVGIIHSPIFNINRGNIYRIKNAINIPSKLYFIYQEKYLAFKKNFNLKKIFCNFYNPQSHQIHTNGPCIQYI